MSRFGRKRGTPVAATDDALATGDVDASDVPAFSDVTIVKRAPADKSAVLAELSAAFKAAEDDTDQPGDRDESDDATAPTAASRQIEPRTPLRTIAIGGNDDLPDAVYLDDEIGAGDSSDTVFIDDDGTGDALLPKDATGRGMEPRLRQRRIGVRRAEGRRRLRRLAVGGAIFLVLASIIAVLGSSLFAIDEVDVTGLDKADPAAVASVVDDLVGTPVLRADTEAAERRLEAIPWIQSARVRTDFPNAATIELRERIAVAAVQGTDGRFRILDREGRVLDVIDGQPIDFAFISGPQVEPLEPGRFVGVGHAAAAAIVTKMRPELRDRLVSIATAVDGSDLRFMLTNEPGGNIEVRLGAAISDNEQIERLIRLELVLDEISETDTTVIDVSTNEATDL